MTLLSHMDLKLCLLMAESTNLTQCGTTFQAKGFTGDVQLTISETRDVKLLSSTESTQLTSFKASWRTATF
jgi:hypothetical protein